MAAVFFIMEVLETFLSKRFGGSSDEASDLPRNLRLARFKKQSDRLAALTGFVFLILSVSPFFLKFPVDIVAISLAVGFGYMAVLLLMLPRKLFGVARRHPLKGLVPIALMVPLVLAIAFWIGEFEALMSTSLRQNVYALSGKDGSRQVLLLRSLEF
jgi:hypothetical protein